MDDDASFSLAILDRLIQERERKLSNPLLADNPRLESRVQKDLDQLLKQKRELERQVKPGDP